MNVNATGVASSTELEAERKAREEAEASKVTKGENLKDLASIAVAKKNLGLEGLSSTSTTLSFMGVAAVSKPEPYTLTFGGNSRTLLAVSSAEVSVASPIGVLSAFAFTEAQAKGLLLGLNSLVKEVTELKQVLKQAIIDLQKYGLLQ
jgi:hypothetical protein